MRGHCTNTTSHWQDGPLVNQIRVRWTWTSTCATPASGSATTYAGDNARWPFTVTRAGDYAIEVRVPANGYLCGEATTRHATGIRYGLDRAGEADVFSDVPVDAASNRGTWQRPWSAPVHLNAGLHTLVLYDAGSGSTGTCTGGNSSKWTFVDSVRVVPTE